VPLTKGIDQMAEGIELGKAYVQIIPSAKGIGAKLGEALGNAPAQAGESAGKTLGGKMVGVIKKVIAAAGIGKAFSKAITEGAALEQSLGGVETLFKENANAVKKYAAMAYKTAGVSANSYMEQVTSFSASLLQSLGGDTAKAAEYANRALVDMSDNANKMGTDMGSIQWAYQGFAKSNYTMLDNLKLGYGGTKEEMKRLIRDASKMTDIQKKLGIEVDASSMSFGNVVNAISVMQESLGIAGTTSQEAATTISGSLASMKAAFSNVLGSLTLGQDIKPALNGLADTVTTFLVGNLLPAVGNILRGFPSAISTFITGAAPQISEAIGQALGNISPDSSGMWKSISAKLGGIWSSLTGLMASLQGLFSSMEPLILGVMSLIDAVLVKIQGAIDVLGPIIEAITPVLQRVFSSIGVFLQEHADELVSAFAGIAAGFVIFKTLTSVVSTITFITTGISKLIGIIKTAGTVLKVLKLAIAALGGPVTLIIAAIAALVAGFIYLWNTCEPFKQFWIDLGTNIANFVSNAAQAIVNFFTVTLPDGISAAITWFQQLPSSMADFLNQVIANVSAWVGNMSSKAVEIGTRFLNNIITFFSQLPYKIGALLGAIIGTVASWAINMVNKANEVGTQFLQNIINFFVQLPGNILNFLSLAYTNVTTWISNMIASAIEVGTRFLQNVVTFFSQLPGNIMQWLMNALTNVAQWAVNLGQKGIEAAKDLVNNVVKGISELPGKLLNIGRQAVEGLWNGIMNAKDWLLGQIGSFVSGIIDGFTSAFKIGSPSRVMRDEVGRWITPGIADGITGNMGSLTSAMAEVKDIIAGQIDSVQTRVSAAICIDPAVPALAYAGGYGGTTNFYQTINTHDSLSESELTREAENLLERSRWKNP
jgi:phage-related protein